MQNIKKTRPVRNICGPSISMRRKERGLSQAALAAKLQLMGCDVTKNTIQRIEAGNIYVTDSELFYLITFFRCRAEDLMDGTQLENMISE